MSHYVNSPGAHMDPCMISFFNDYFFSHPFHPLNGKDSVRAGDNKALEEQLGHPCVIGGIFQNNNSENQSHLQHIVLIMAVGSPQMETVTKTARANAARPLLSNTILQRL